VIGGNERDDWPSTPVGCPSSISVVVDECRTISNPNSAVVPFPLRQHRVSGIDVPVVDVTFGIGFVTERPVDRRSIWARNVGSKVDRPEMALVEAEDQLSFRTELHRTAHVHLSVWEKNCKLKDWRRRGPKCCRKRVRVRVRARRRF